MFISRKDFGDNFKWGISTAAYQIEGAFDSDGKGLSIWDDFVNRRGKIRDGHHGRMACDFYNRFQEDNNIIRQLGIPNHRFSLSWSRIFPDGEGVINQKGIDFYNRLIDHSLEQGIEPWITLYHWDLPLKLQQKGGWVNRDVVNWFLNYVSTCEKYFSDRVSNWIVLNEPMVFTGAGYFLGIHAPGKKGLNNFLAAVHHATLCQAKGGRLLKSLNPALNVGTTFSCSHIEPYRNTLKDQLAAHRVDALLNRLFVEPLLGKGYPLNDLKILKGIEKFIKDDDEEEMAFNMDFIGVQNYTREIVKYDFFTPYLKARLVNAVKRKVSTTLMNWEVYPAALYHMLLKFGSHPNAPELIVTENGAAFQDEITEQQVMDVERLSYLKENIFQVYRARQDGINVNGYFIWTLLDNFEWAEGYHPRFGIVYTDFETQARTIKESGLWYQRFLAP